MQVCKETNSSPTKCASVEPDEVISPNPMLSDAVPGLQLLEEFVTKGEENELMEVVDSTSPGWTEEMSRRVQV